MLLKFLLWCAVFLICNFNYAIVASVKLDSSILEDEGFDQRVIVGPRQADTFNGERHSEDDETFCIEGEFEWENGTCATCLQHNDACEASRQCCSVDNMSCYRIRNMAPLCKCDLHFGWDEDTQTCVYVPPPSFLMIVAFVILGAACVIGITAICVQCAKCIQLQWSRHRGTDIYDSRRRQHRRGPRPTAPRERRLSSMVSGIPNNQYPTKPPGYEDIFGMPTISQAMPRQLTGSIRSLPPAYTPQEESDPPVASTEENVTSQEPVVIVTDQQPTQSSEQQSIPQSEGIDNPTFNTEQHI